MHSVWCKIMFSLSDDSWHPRERFSHLNCILSKLNKASITSHHNILAEWILCRSSFSFLRLLCSLDKSYDLEYNDTNEVFQPSDHSCKYSIPIFRTKFDWSLVRTQTPLLWISNVYFFCETEYWEKCGKFKHRKVK